jgi:hypothetical protein
MGVFSALFTALPRRYRFICGAMALSAVLVVLAAARAQERMRPGAWNPQTPDP